MVRRLDDAVDQDRHGSGRQRDTGPVGARRARIARGGHVARHEQRGQSGDRGHREEDARPGEVLEQPAAHDRPERDRHAGARSPKPDRPRALAALDEDVGDDRERGREDHRRAEPHYAARDDQLARGRGQAAANGREAEHGETREQHALAADAVARAAHRQQQGREDEAVGVHDPLELARGRVQLAHERGERHVDDRRVQVDREGGEEQRRQDEWLGSSHARGSTGVT